MIKAIKTTNIKTEIELPTPFCYKYINESKSFSMIGIVTDNSIMEITEEHSEDTDFSSFEISINHTVSKEDIFPYMYENIIPKEEFENYYHSVMYKINKEFSNPVQEELNA